MDAIASVSLVLIAMISFAVSQRGHGHDCETSGKLQVVSTRGGSKGYGYGSSGGSSSRFWQSYTHDRNLLRSRAWNTGGFGGPSRSGRWSSRASARTVTPPPLPDYHGCFYDDVHGMLTGSFYDRVTMHIRYCISRCRRGLYRFAGLQNTFCICGNSYDPDLYVPMPETECNITCPGNAGQICGGVFRLSVYKLR